MSWLAAWLVASIVSGPPIGWALKRCAIPAGRNAR